MEALQDVITLPKSWCPAKTMPRPQCAVLKEVKITQRQKKKTLQRTSSAHTELLKICVHAPNIRKAQNKNGVNGRTPQKKAGFSKQTTIFSIYSDR